LNLNPLLLPPSFALGPVIAGDYSSLSDRRNLPDLEKLSAKVKTANGNSKRSVPIGIPCPFEERGLRFDLLFEQQNRGGADRQFERVQSVPVPLACR
jgi:hypothetical protein